MMAGLALKSVFITGSNRGIGLELVRQFVALSQPPQHIFATCRKPHEAKDLQEIASNHPNVHIREFEVIDYSAYPAVVEWVQNSVGADGLTVLINNAATMKRSDLSEVTREEMMSTLEINSVAPLMLTKAFLPLLKKSAAGNGVSGLSVSRAAVINITSLMGSIEDNTSGGVYSYRTSKTAMNMITKSLAVDLKPDGILAVVLHPGWVRTDMGGPKGLIDTSTCIQGLLNVMAGLTDKDAGSFHNYKGDKMPW